MKVLVFIIVIVILFFLSSFLSEYISLLDIPFIYNSSKKDNKEDPRNYIREELKKVPFMCQAKFYPSKFFPGLKDLQENWEIIREEALEVYKNSPLLNLNRQRREWTQTSTQGMVDKYSARDGWISAWNVDSNKPNKDWLNYGLVVKDTPLTENAKRCPKTMELLSNIEGINMAGFSWMRPYTEIKSHRDTTGLKYSSLGYHLGLIVPPEGAVLTVDGVQKQEQQGEVIIFDSTFFHSATNASSIDRILLYIDFQINL